MSNLDELDTALSSIVLEGNQTVRVDLSDLRFIDLTALRRLTSFAVQLREGGCEVTTRGAPPLLHRVTQILPGPDQFGLT